MANTILDHKQNEIKQNHRFHK